MNGNPGPKNEGNGVIEVEDVEDEGEGMYSACAVGIASRFEQHESLEILCPRDSWDVDLSSWSIPLATVRSQCLWIKMGMSENARKRCVFMRALIVGKLKNILGKFFRYHLCNLIRDMHLIL